ncbi:MAG: ABC transporter ATP-binding protein [bacterium]|uniref:Cytochrome c biogenesis ATP-binding export protein ccmA n=2 Tax=Bacteria candidate phyla TaxID=1783234 RepID=A0A101I1N9_UNCT6|nr:MAG: Cytochrome c biogenesis ATP-binding export protein ccmA [candidate division TA06 bacterium 32_111]KUK87381.1 MAG: Cytochrome c biogenesis ATP-binding export protein ccmA [candidate division TA06 bacterium 34_109]MDI6701164.1 ABC transporter ATP-binding protein [bacterium]HAF07785.1 ABC transporter [candidate division WOR-3 bacterium]HCP17303.1 ABC transporter [candidate division WOR-3 bacterium]
MGKEIILEVKNLTKRYGKKTAVNNISFKLSGGDIFGFIGPNGAGKTTTIKCIGGLLEYDGGDVLINGKSNKGFDQALKRSLGYVPDTPFLYDKLTGREFLYFVGRLYGMDKKSLEKKIDEYSKKLEFSDYMDIRSEEYSHGMKQRIIIASSFIHSPDIFLIDEPMVGLDPKSSKIVKDLFKEFSFSNRILFISTHTLSLAEEICNKIGIMDKGNLVYFGSIDNLKESLKKSNLEELFLEITKNDN